MPTLLWTIFIVASWAHRTVINLRLLNLFVKRH
jgi:hypothetical protein